MTSFLIVDAQSVKNTDSAELKGYDAGKKVSGIKRNELHTFVVLPKRWVVERSFVWLEKCRRLWKNCERKLNTSLQFVPLAFLALLLSRS
jgi:transposase